MTRIFAFGESHVKYNYPTWADILLNDYEGYNCGEIGCSNQLIIQRLVECNLQYNFQENDFIIINWSNFFREDRYHSNNGWHCPGNIFHNLHMKPFMLNNYYYNNDAEWADLNYYLYRDLTSLTLIQNFLKSLKSVVVQTHTGNFLEDTEFLSIPNVENLIKLFKNSIIYDIQSVQEFNYPNYIEKNRPKFTFNNKEFFIEDHPLPNEHLEWLNQKLLPFCNLKISSETEKWCNDWNDKIMNQEYVKYPTNWKPKTPEWIV